MKIMAALALLLLLTSAPVSFADPCTALFDVQTTNPIIAHWLTSRSYPDGRPFPFDQLKPEHYVPALKAAAALVDHAVQTVTTHPAPATFENTAFPVMNAFATFRRVQKLLRTLAQLNGDQIPAAAANLASELGARMNSLRFRHEPLDARLRQIPRADLTGDQNRILDSWIATANREGLNLSSEKKKELLELDIQINQVKGLFGANYDSSDKKTFRLPKETSFDSGMPRHILDEAKRLAQSEGYDGYVFSLRREETNQTKVVLEFASDEQTRKVFYEAYRDRAKTDPLKQDFAVTLANLRLRRAQILGAQSHSDSVLASTMAGSLQEVRNFYSAVKPSILTMLESEMETLRVFKEKKTGSRNLEPWDVQYYARLYEQETIMDPALLEPYFEMNGTIERILEVHGEIFGVRYERDSQTQTWHADIQTYKVYDKATNQLMGFLSFDFFQREHKVSVIWASELVPAGRFRSPEGFDHHQTSHVMTALDLAKIPHGTPQFLSLNEVRSILHELGHDFHALNANNGFPLYGGLNTSNDFVELPSQILEHLIDHPATLNRIARHYQTGAPLPTEWLPKIKDMRSSFIALRSLARRALMAELDLAWHSVTAPIALSTKDFDARANKDWEAYPYLVELSGSSPTFFYIFESAYDSTFYGYQWCEMLDESAFQVFRDAGVFDLETGLRFRKLLLEPGGLVKAREAFQEFIRGKYDPMDFIRKYK